MQAFLNITKALADESRVRALLCLTEGEACVCQIIATLKLSPATVSKHMSILQQAGLVQRRKEGKWHYYRLAGPDAPAAVRQAIRWTLQSVREEKLVVRDAKTLCCVKRQNLQEVCSCYNAN